MQLFTAIFVKNKYIFLTILLQQKLAQLWVFSSFRTVAGLRPKKCGAGACGIVSRAGARRVRAKLLKLLRVWGEFKFCGCGPLRTQNFKSRRSLMGISLRTINQKNLTGCKAFEVLELQVHCGVDCIAEQQIELQSRQLSSLTQFWVDVQTMDPNIFDLCP